ncbi:MAG: hypothetical protein Q8P41_01225 [Pseudomonadota bacterium]|nr:hypothetical protein [Pseudomonadota bacterium]
MNRSLSEALAAHQPGDVTVRVVNGFFSVLPFAASWTYPGTLGAAAESLDPAIAARVMARADVLAREPGPQGALAAFDFLDKGDAGIALFSGLRGAVKIVRGDAASALETDPQQAADAGLKAAGLSYITWKLFEGTLDEKANALLGTQSGRALLTWYVATDVVLPFADNLVSGGTELITDLIDKQAAANVARLAVIAGPEVAEAAGMLDRLGGTLKSFAGQAASFAQPLSDYAKDSLPGLLGTADKVTGVAATGVDALSAYRALGAALVAEVCLAKALADVRAQVAVELEAAEAARRLAEAEAENARIEAEAERRRKEEAAAAERKRQEAAAEAERVRLAAVAERERQEAEKARLELEQRKEEARAAGIAAEIAMREASRQREDYSLDKPEDAASLKTAPIKVTRTAEMEVAASATPAKSGCMGCGAGIVLFVLAGAAASVTMWA